MSTSSTTAAEAADPADPPPRTGSSAVGTAGPRRRARRVGTVPTPRRAAPPLVTGLHRSDALPMLITAVIALALTALPLALNPSYYFTDDTAGGAYGQWYELGEQLRAGNWPMLSLEAWMAGNHIAEGQWGLFNPVVWIIGLITTVVPQAHMVAAGVKLFFLTVAALGSYALARSFGARPTLSVLAGIAAPVAGWTLYLDATAWVTNLEVWAYFPWVMVGVRSFMHHRRGRGLAVGLIAGLLLVTVGYVQGTIMLVLMFLALGIEAVALRRWGALGRMFLAGIPMGLMAVTVYLPGLLSSAVTVRDDQVENTGFMTLTLNGLAVSTAPSGRPDLAGWWGRYPDVPYTYIAWFLPLLLLISAKRVRAVLPRLISLLILAGIVLLWAAGPSQLGPLRFPIRTMPWVALLLIVLTAVLLSRAVDTTRLRAKLPLLAVATVFSFWLSYAAVIDTWRIQVLWGIGCAIALIGVGLLWSSGRRVLRRAGTLALLGVTVVFSGLQTLAYVDDASAFGVTGFPTHLDEYTDELAEGRGEALVVGDPRNIPGGNTEGQHWEETLWGSTWYLADQPVANAYSPTGYRAFNDDVCMDPYYGGTCGELLGTLFTPDPTTGTPLVDLMSIDTIQVLASEERPAAEIRALEVPDGWTVAEQDELSVTWVREGGIEPVGGPTAWSDGLEVTVLEQGPHAARLQVTNPTDEPGRVVLSRLDWPGYRISGAEHVEPLRGYLVQVEVPAGAQDQVVEVVFRPPGWELEMGALALSLLMTAVLFVLAGVRAVRRRRGRGLRT